ncbi:hypothetical protein BC829DRAFT_365868 [Chytridium lagenaria]|nr:hypothetical protein BC829DRAFT_365868 [Chytridium lagenaria]
MNDNCGKTNSFTLKTRDSYDIQQLVPAVDAIIVKLEEYLQKALKKPAYYMSTMCDPVQDISV